MYLARRFTVWLLNVLLPCFLITALCFCGFAIEPENNHDRMAIYAGLLLAIVGVKFSIAEKLPDIPYTTALDNYVLFCIIVASLAMCAAALSTLCYSNYLEGCSASTVDQVTAIGLALFFCGGNILYGLYLRNLNGQAASRKWTKSGRQWANAHSPLDENMFSLQGLKNAWQPMSLSVEK